MTTPKLARNVSDIRQRENRRRGLLNHAADCEREAWELPPGGASADLFTEARNARLAAMALAPDTPEAA